MTKYLYQRPTGLPVKSDAGWDTAVILHANNSRAMYIFTNEFRSSRETQETLGNFAKKYFTDISDRPLTINGHETESGEDVGRKLLKRQHHKRYNTPHKESVNSPIEQIFREALIKHGIKFEEQVEIVLDNKKFSVPDFVIGEAKLIIYCDGTEFHKDPERIIMDKQQDRILQAQGFNVFRFSGSEITSSVGKCIDEVKMFIRKKLEI